MVYDKIDDLMNRAIDGLLSPEEREELENYIHDHPEAGNRFERLQKAAEILGHTRAVEPPEEIKREVMAAIKSSPEKYTSHAGFIERIKSALSSRTAWRYGYVYAFGVICGVMILAVSSGIIEQNSAMDPMQAAGSMITQSKADTELLDSKAVNVGGTAGTITSRASGDYIILDIEVISDGVTVLDIGYDHNRLEYAGFWKPQSFAGSISTQGNHMTISQQGKISQSLLFFNKSHAESYLKIGITSGDDSVHEQLPTFTAEN